MAYFSPILTWYSVQAFSIFGGIGFQCIIQPFRNLFSCDCKSRVTSGSVHDVSFVNLIFGNSKRRKIQKDVVLSNPKAFILVQKVARYIGQHIQAILSESFQIRDPKSGQENKKFGFSSMINFTWIRVGPRDSGSKIKNTGLARNETSTSIDYSQRWGGEMGMAWFGSWKLQTKRTWANELVPPSELLFHHSERLDVSFKQGQVSSLKSGTWQ